MTEPPADAGEARVAPSDDEVAAAMADLLGTRLTRLRAATDEAAAILRTLTAQRAERDSNLLTCTASFVDVGELT